MQDYHCKSSTPSSSSNSYRPPRLGWPAVGENTRAPRSSLIRTLGSPTPPPEPHLIPAPMHPCVQDPARRPRATPSAMRPSRHAPPARAASATRSRASPPARTTPESLCAISPTCGRAPPLFMGPHIVWPLTTYTTHQAEPAVPQPYPCSPGLTIIPREVQSSERQPPGASAAERSGVDRFNFIAAPLVRPSLILQAPCGTVLDLTGLIPHSIVIA